MKPAIQSMLFAGGLALAISPLARTTVSPQDPSGAQQERGGGAQLPQEVGDDQTYIPVVLDRTFEELHQDLSAQEPEVAESHRQLLLERYDLADRASDVPMSAGRKNVQRGVRVRLPQGATWERLTQMTPQDIRSQDLWPAGFRPLPHVKHAEGGMVFPDVQIDAIRDAEQRDLARFDVSFVLPDHLMAEFPPPLFLTNRPDLGDVTQGQVLTIRNFHELLLGKVTPLQMEGMRMLLTPFPQQQFNTTADRRVKESSTGVACLDCHVNGHTNGAFHLNPDTRPQALRFRLDTPSLRGMFNQQIHGSKRALRSVEDFTEFEQRTAYFDGDHVTAAKKGLNTLDRGSVVAAMGQMQSMFDFPPAPKLDLFGRLEPARASEQELRGEQLFFGKARCGECHPAPHYLNNLMQDLEVGRFYEPRMVAGHWDHPVGPIKTTTLRGIKDSPPYLHDGRLLTLDDTVLFFDLVLGTRLAQQERDDIVAFLMTL